MKYINNYQTIEDANEGVNLSPNVSVVQGQVVFTNFKEEIDIIFEDNDGKVVSKLKNPPVIEGIPESVSLDSDNTEVQLQISAQNLYSDIQITTSNQAITLSDSIIPQNGPFPYDITISCESNEDITGTITFSTQGLVMETPFYFIATEQPVEKAITEMTREDVHWLLYQNQEDAILDYDKDGRNTIMYTISEAYKSDPSIICHVHEPTKYSCQGTLPCSLAFQLAGYVIDDFLPPSPPIVPIWHYHLEDIVSFPLYDGEIICMGTFGELLVKVASFIEYYKLNQGQYSLEDIEGLKEECFLGDTEDSMFCTNLPDAVTFAPMTPGIYDGASEGELLFHSFNFTAGSGDTGYYYGDCDDGQIGDEITQYFDNIFEQQMHSSLIYIYK